jgi:excisionase family DNA binding protein
MADCLPPLLTVAQAADLAGFSRRAIYRAITRGDLRAVRVCSRLRIPCEWFDEWLEQSVVRPEPAVVVPAAPLPRGSFKALIRQGDERRSS